VWNAWLKTKYNPENVSNIAVLFQLPSVVALSQDVLTSLVTADIRSLPEENKRISPRLTDL